jgi:hypothetical protein
VQCMNAAYQLRRGAQRRRPCSCLPQNLRNTPLAGVEHQQGGGREREVLLTIQKRLTGITIRGPKRMEFL